MQAIELENGMPIPQLGLGVYQAGFHGATEQAVTWALEAGYRHIDTASAYGNEDEVGRAIAASDVAREDVFITAKVWNDDIRNHTVEEAFERTLDQLQTDYIDLYLLHWPTEGRTAAWHVLEKLYQQGRALAIGVSNFHQHHLEDLDAYANINPMLNQIESHPANSNQALIDYCQDRGITVSAWSPLGGPRVNLLNHPVLTDLATRYGKTPAQIVLRWHMQRGVVAIPKSSHKERIVRNARIFDFALSAADMQLISSLDQGFRVGPDPDDFNF